MATKTEVSYNAVEKITDRHLRQFADRFLKRQADGGVMGEVIIERDGVMLWPDEKNHGCVDGVDNCEHQLEYNRLANEIERQVMKAIRVPLMEAFRKAATEVLNLGTDPRVTKIRHNAEAVAAEVEDLILRTAGQYGDLIVACRPDLSVAGLRDDAEMAEIDRRLDLQAEVAHEFLQSTEIPRLIAERLEETALTFFADKSR